MVRLKQGAIDQFLRDYEPLIYRCCSSFIKSLPHLRDDFLQTARLAAWEAHQKFDPEKGTIEACISQYISWRCISFYNENKGYGIALPTGSVGDRAPRVLSLDAMPFEPVLRGNGASEDSEASQVQDFLNYLDNQEIHGYAVLAFSGATAPEIRSQMNLSAHEADLLQQRFKYWLDKYFGNPDSRAERRAKSKRNEEKRLKKRAAPGEDKPEKIEGEKRQRRRNLPKPSPLALPEQQEWKAKNTTILRFNMPNFGGRQYRSPLFETDLSKW